MVLATFGSSDPPCGPRDSLRFPAGQSRRECPFPEQLKHRPSLESRTVCVNRHRSAYWHPLSVSQLMHAVLWTTLAALIGSSGFSPSFRWKNLLRLLVFPLKRPLVDFQMNPVHSLTSPLYHIVGFSRGALCGVPRLTESHFTSFCLKKFRKHSDLLHSRPEIYAQMLSHRGQPVCSLSSPQPG